MSNLNTNEENTVENDKTNEEKTDGLPDISDTNKKNPIVFIVIAFIIMIGFYAMSHFHKPTITNSNTNDENFNIQNSQQAPALNTQLQKPNSIQATISAQPTENNNDAQKTLEQRIQAPMMLVNQNQSNATQQTSPQIKENNDPNTQFMNDVSNQETETVQATVLQHRDILIAQGNLIHAVLETAIDSDLPGYLRAIVSEPVYSEDGSEVLIQPGSRLIGQYKSGLLQGQSRVFVVWTRLIEPNGISIQLGSPGIDSLGMAGQEADQIDYHFWQTFGTASLLSVLGAGTSNIGVSNTDQNNASQAYREAVASSLSQSAQNSLQNNTVIQPTLHINQGAAIMVFVARDLRFDQQSKSTELF